MLFPPFKSVNLVQQILPFGIQRSAGMGSPLIVPPHVELFRELHFRRAAMIGLFLIVLFEFLIVFVPDLVV